MKNDLKTFCLLTALAAAGLVINLGSAFGAAAPDKAGNFEGEKYQHWKDINVSEMADYLRSQNGKTFEGKAQYARNSNGVIGPCSVSIHADEKSLSVKMTIPSKNYSEEKTLSGGALIYGSALDTMRACLEDQSCNTDHSGMVELDFNIKKGWFRSSRGDLRSISFTEASGDQENDYACVVQQ